MRLARRLRGIAASSLLWTIVWGFAGAVVYAIAGISWTTRAGDPLTLRAVLQYAPIGALFFGTYGMLSGAAFAVILALVERRRSLDDLSVRRVAAWGALGGIAILLLNVALILVVERGQVPNDFVPTLLGMSLLGAACAAGSLLLARRIPGTGIR